jgi:coproporphyrinogen III oxidase-like Fe-S oxidoreductase
MGKEWGKTHASRERALYRLIADTLTGRGYMRSTAWCFSRETTMIDEYVVEHHEYAGAGAGSFGYIDGVMYSNTFSVGGYIDRLRNGNWAVERSRQFTPGERYRYHFLMDLFGGAIDLTETERTHGATFRRRLWKELAFMKATGAARLHNGILTLDGPGFYYVVIMMREFFTGVNNFRAIMMASK